jgi:hypothetical protein
VVQGVGAAQPRLNGDLTIEITPRAKKPALTENDPGAPAETAALPSRRDDGTRYSAMARHSADLGASQMRLRLDAQLEDSQDQGSLPEASRVVAENFDLLSGGDEYVTRDDLMTAYNSNDPRITPEMKAQLAYLLSSPTAWNALDVGSGEGKVDGKISREDATTMAAELAGDDYSSPTPGVEGAIDTDEEAGAVYDRYMPLLDTAAGRGGRDGAYSAEDLDAILRDPNAPPELKAAAQYFFDTGLEHTDLDSDRGTIDHEPLHPGVRRELDAAAFRARERDAGRPATPLNEMGIAHRTNTPEEMLAALEDPNVQIFEGDVGAEGYVQLPGGQKAIMAHDPQQTDGMTLREWLEIGRDSGKTLKLDIKEGQVVDNIIADVKASGVDPAKLIFNADVIDGPGASGGKGVKSFVSGGLVGVDDLLRLREEFPEATIAVSARTGGGAEGYTTEQLDELTTIAAQVGEPVMIVLRSEYVTPETIAYLEQKERELGIDIQISVWNDPSTEPYTAEEAEAKKEYYRGIGVDGIIDIRPSE